MKTNRGVIATTGIGMDSNECVQRALRAAFKFAGAAYPIELQEDIRWTGNLRKLCRNLGLEVYTEGVICIDDRPVLVVYEVPDQYFEENEDGKKYHAIFCSDIGPLHRYAIHTLVAGWENLVI